jgi:hypothetical protein
MQILKTNEPNIFNKTEFNSLNVSGSDIETVVASGAETKSSY